jgi:adenylosuccinate synthase
MPAYAVIGGQWGDEGKGKVIDYLAGQSDCVVRYAGGNNAGHTVVNDRGEFQLHLVPSGICWPGVTGIIGNGVVVNPDVLLGEVAGLQQQGIDTERLFISDRAHVIMPYHILLDALQEQARGRDAIGTTGQGIGPAYVDKASRDGIRVGDLLDDKHLPDRIKAAVSMKNRVITGVFDGDPVDADEVLERCLAWGEKLRPAVRPTEQMVQDLLAQGKKVLLEGAQGTLLDVDHGSYPYVTSSSPSIGGAITGLGINPQAIEGVVGVFKAYSTRVGGGPMPTEMHGAAGDELREKAHEYGTTTGRPRRIGWFDAVAARYSRQINGFTGMVLTRLDILDGMDDVKICVGYKVGDREVERFPANTALLEECEPVYERMPGWKEPTASATQTQQLPQNALDYVRRIEKLVGCNAQIISTGPSREETIAIDQVIH